jgi:hypothetical protein
MRTRRLNWLRCMAATGGVLVALGVGASPALGSTYTLNLSGPSTALVGDPTIIQASGSNPPDDFFFSYLDAHAIPTSALSTCPSGYLDSSQVADSTYADGGEALATAQHENVDAAGNWSTPIGWTPRVPGQFLICGYTNDGAQGTLATASLTLTVQGADSGACEDARDAVAKAKKKLKRAKAADNAQKIKKAKKKLKKAKKQKKAAC